MKYYVSVTEILNKVVCVEADSKADAIHAAHRAYDNGEIILGSDNFCGEQIEMEDDQQFYRDNESDGPVYQRVQ